MYQKPDKKKINDYIHTINQYESKVRSMKHKLDIKNIQIQELKEQLNEPKPEPELIEAGRGADEPEPSDAQEQFICKVCGHEAKTLHYLKMHVQRSKDSEHQAYMEEHF